MSNPFRNLPAVNSVLNHPHVREQLEDVPRPQITALIRYVLSEMRDRLREAPGAGPEQALDAAAGQTVRMVSRLKLRRLSSVINATGIVLHTNLGRAPLSDSSIARIVRTARATNVEIDLESGQRSRRGAHAEELLKELTGASGSLIVNNCAAATMLALQGIAAGKEVIISRGQLVEIGGGFRLPEVFEAAGVTLREIGTSNRTQVEDYARAISDRTGAILRVHRSNFRISGFVTEPSTAELAELARQSGLPLIDDLGSGCLTSLTPLELHEPDVASSLKSRADLVLFSGDKLLGGPQSGILIGDQDCIEQLRRHPVARTVRVCKLTLAALEATLENHLDGNALRTIPVLSMLSMPADEVRERCTAILRELSDIGLDLSVVQCKSEVGGGSLADQSISSFAVRIGVSHPDKLVHLLRTGHARILGRIEEGAVLLDLRTVQADQDAILVDELRRVGREAGRTDG